MDSTLSFAYDPNKITQYIIIVQNIIDNSLIRGLNKGFKAYRDYKSKDLNNNKKDLKKNDIKSNLKDSRLSYDVELDIDKHKTAILVEKAKYILPFLQKFERQLPAYLDNVAKQSLNIDEYFANLNIFWTNILNQSIIGANESPLKFKNELLEKERVRLEMVKGRLEKERVHLERDLAKNLEADLAAEQVLNEFKNKQKVELAKNYVREQDILQESRKQNYSVVEWSQYNQQFKQHVIGLIGVFDSAVSGIGGLIKVPTDFIIGLASDTIMSLGKVLIMVIIFLSALLAVYNKILSVFSFTKTKKE